MDITGAVQSFVRGAKGQFMTLEEALTHPDAERKLLDLHDPGVRYDAATHTITHTRDGLPTTTFVPPEFHSYMDMYRQNVRYVTDNGTPWLTREEEESPSYTRQRSDYFTALKSGTNTDIAMINWRSTNARKKDTGHTALSMGHLNLKDGSSLADNVPLFDYEPEITGSFYPSTTPAIRPFSAAVKHFKKAPDSPFGQHMDAARSRLGEHPVAHTVGTFSRDFALPVGAGLTAGVAAGVATKMFGLIESEKGQRGVDDAIKVMSLALLAYSAGKVTGALKTSTGVVLLKEEAKGSGMLATLVTRPQLDIMEHALYGMYKTYHSRYNILKSNCADFADKMMAEIGLDTANLLEEAMQETIPSAHGFAEKIRNATVPYQTRPDRLSHAMRMRNNGNDMAGRVEIDGQELAVRLVEVSGQPSVLIETPKTTDRFANPPIETFQKVLEKGITLEPDSKGNRYHFALQPDVKPLPPGPATQAGNAR